MNLIHHKWEKSGRTFKTEEPNQFVYNAFIGQRNIDVGNGNFAPYLYDSIKKIAKFADCEFHLLSTGLRFKRNGENFDIALHPETKKGTAWERTQTTVSGLSINEVHTEGPTDYLEISYKLNTNDQESTVKVQVGGSHRAKLSFEVKTKIAGEQRLTLEHSFAQKPKQIYIKESLASEKQYLAGYEFDFCHLFWGKDEVEDHKPEESLDILKLHLKEGTYKKDEIKKLSPTDWGPNQIAANSDDCGEKDNGTYSETGEAGNILYLSDSYDWEYIGWRWDNVTASGTIDNSSYLKLYNGGDNGDPTECEWTLGGVEEADPATFGAANKPSGDVVTTAAETGAGIAADLTITGADMAGILQELVNSYTYSGSQALALIMKRTNDGPGYYWAACWDQSKGNDEYGELKIVYTAAGGQTYQVACSDGIGIAGGAGGLGDATDIQVHFDTSIADGLQGADSSPGRVEINASTLDGINLGDSLSSALQILASLTDGSNLGDTSSTISQILASISDGSDLGDSLSAISQMVESISDGSDLGDTPSFAKNLILTVQDGLKFADSLQAIAKFKTSVSDGVDLGDSSSAVLQILADLSDGSNLGDSPSVILQIVEQLSDGLKARDIVDSALVSAAIQVAITDGLKFADSLAAYVQFKTAITDGLKAGDTLLAVLQVLLAVSDGMEFKDTINVVSHAMEQIADGLKMGDTVNAQIAAFFCSILDGLKAGDTIDAVCTLDMDISDAAKVGDLASALIQFSTIISDGGKLSDVIAHTYLAAGGYQISVAFTLKGRKTEFVVKGRLLDFKKKTEKTDFTLH